MSKKNRLQNENDLPNISPDSKVADILEAYPSALGALIDLGFDTLKSAVTRKTVAKLFTLEQAANFRGITVDDFINTIKRAAGVEVSDKVSSDNKTNTAHLGGFVPELLGDISFLGLVPCPIRNILMDKFDTFVQQFTASTGSTVAWWMAGEGTGTNDVRKWLVDLMRNRDFDLFPDLIMAVGTEVFLQERYGRTFYREHKWLTVQNEKKQRTEFKALEDPKGMLSLQFAVLFTFSCRPDRIPSGKIPQSWTDLLEPVYKGQIAFPTLDLPIVSDLLAALYHYLGEKNFKTLAANTISAIHPSTSSPRAGLKDVPGVVILPLHFSKLAISTGAIQVIPEDGPVAVPAYIATKANAHKDTEVVKEYLSSKDFLELFWKYGSFLPTNGDTPFDLDLSRLITRPWESILQKNADTFVDGLSEMIESGGTS